MTPRPRPLALGLIGPGRWGRSYLRTVAALPGADIAATAARDWRDVLARERLDGVIVATPPATHAEIAIAAIEAGLPVLVEKPLTLSLAEARRVLAAAETHGGRVLVDHVHLFQPAWAELKRLATALGTLTSMRGNAGAPGPFRDDVPVLWDWGPHDVAMCLDLAGALPDSVVATRTQRGEGETVAISLDFGPARAEIEVANVYDTRRRRFEAAFEGGTLVMDMFADPMLSLSGPNGATRPIAVADTPPLTVAVQRFLDMIAAPAPDPAPLRLAVDVVDVLERCQGALDA